MYNKKINTRLTPAFRYFTALIYPDLAFKP